MCTLLAPILIHLLASPVYYHQFAMQELELRNRRQVRDNGWAYYSSLYGSGLAIMFGTVESPKDLDDTEGVLRYVFGHLPRRSYVLPTEQLHYFRCKVNGTEIAGNMRVADLDRGRLSFVYYPVASPRDVYSIAITTDDDNGMKVRVLPSGYKVSLFERTVEFVIPRLQEVRPVETSFDSCEQAVGLVWDESGQRLWLVYNSIAKAFYYVVPEEFGVREPLDPVMPGLFIGRRTRFAYYRFAETGRLLLIGVNYHDIVANNYFDGPGDQVPIRIPLRELIYEAYPGAQLKGGIDEYGVMLNRDQWMRYAICPYDRYTTMTQLVGRVEQIERRTPSSIAEASWLLTRERWNDDAWLEWVRVELEKERLLNDVEVR